MSPLRPIHRDADFPVPPSMHSRGPDGRLARSIKPGGDRRGRLPSAAGQAGASSTNGRPRA
jgi:hypothetical protein